MRIRESAAIGLRRFGEMLLSCCIISALLMLLRKGSHLKDTMAVDWTIALLGLTVFIAINVIFLRRCRFVLGRDVKMYYRANLIAWLLFTMLHQVILAIDTGIGAVYLYAFQLAKVCELAWISARASAILFDVILLVLIFASQIGMRAILREAEMELSARYE